MLSSAFISPAGVILADDSTVSPRSGGSGYHVDLEINWNFFPWLGKLVDAVGSFQAIALVILTAILIGCAVLWAFSHFGDVGHIGTTAKIGIGVVMIGAALVGGAAEIIAWFAAQGAGV